MADGYAIGQHKISVELTRKVEGDLVASQWSIQRWFRHEHESVALLVALTANMAAVVNSEHAAILMRDAARIVEAEELRSAERAEEQAARARALSGAAPPEPS